MDILDCMPCDVSQQRRTKQQAEEEIQFVINASTLGLVLAARSSRGLCAVFLDNDREALQRELRGRFPAARLIEDGDGSFAAPVIELVERPAGRLDLPLDARGTAFQQAVWQALRQIPAGSTASYTEIARRLGRPKAVRAVGQACAANSLAVVIPCHRAVRCDGSLSGYRWGLERKRALLEREAAA